MAWFDWLRSIPAPVIDHPKFGRVRASYRPKSGLWLWEMLDWLDTPHGRVSATFDAGPTGPGPHHEQAWDEICANVDGLTRKAAPLVASALADWLEKPFPADPWAELGWEGAHLTESSGEFELNYFCKSWPDAMIAVFFEQREPTLVQLDD
jgi:hypothetical protein